MVLYLEGRLTPHADVRTTIEVPEARCVVRSGEDSHCDHTGGTTQATKKRDYRSRRFRRQLSGFCHLNGLCRKFTVHALIAPP